MFLKELTEVIPIRSQDVMIGTAFCQLATDTGNLANASGLAQVARDLIWQAEIDRSNPIDKIKVFVSFNLDVTHATLAPDAYAGILKNIYFARNGVGVAPGGTVPRGTLAVVNARGVDILQRRYQVQSPDRDTFNLPLSPTVRTVQYQVCYDIDLADDQLDDPLRAHTLCPVHLDSANPTLKLTFPAQNELDINAAPTLKYKLLQVEVHVLRRDMPPERTAEVIAAGGFIETDMITREYTGLQAGPNRIVIDSPGEYEQMLITTYSIGTGATQARGLIHDPNQRLWRVKQQGKVRREFTVQGLQSLNEESKTHAGGVPTWATYNYSCDFVSDQQGSPDNNLGSLLDTNLDAQNGQQTTLEFNVASSGLTSPRIAVFARRILTPIGDRRFKFA